MGRGLFPPRCYKPDVRCDKCYKCSSLSFCFVSSVLMVCAEGVNIAKIEWLMLIHHNNVFFFLSFAIFDHIDLKAFYIRCFRYISVRHCVFYIIMILRTAVILLSCFTLLLNVVIISLYHYRQLLYAGSKVESPEL